MSWAKWQYASAQEVCVCITIVKPKQLKSKKNSFKFQRLGEKILKKGVYIFAFPPHQNKIRYTATIYVYCDQFSF